jgi:hypothetical protein
MVMENVTIKARLCNACGNGEFTVRSCKTGKIGICKKCGGSKFQLVARSAGVGCKCSDCGMEYRPKELFGVIGRVDVECCCGKEYQITNLAHNGLRGKMVEENWEY